MEPRVIALGNPAQPPEERRGCGASMEPRVIALGNVALRHVGVVHHLASMEPRVIALGNTGSDFRGKVAVVSFNGAEGDRPRKQG